MLWIYVFDDLQEAAVAWALSRCSRLYTVKFETACPLPYLIIHQLIIGVKCFLVLALMGYCSANLSEVINYLW